MGGEVNFRNGAMAYGPAGTAGEPGVMTIDPNASLSALEHEYQHFLDDMASGWTGNRIQFNNMEASIQWEKNAYQKEIDIARQFGLDSVVAQLEKNLEQRIAQIRKMYGL